ncbi:MAG: hypothetical protein BRC31_05585 [Actinobacteria bacterium QS_5_72_10]|nr:MAG: hypothetical protein BRC31_05585 [Actinobacteria bacterium QS_5_72_10]
MARRPRRRRSRPPTSRRRVRSARRRRRAALLARRPPDRRGLHRRPGRGGHRAGVGRRPRPRPPACGPDRRAGRRAGHLHGCAQPGKRGPAGLDGQGLCAAAIESVAENGADAVVAPLWWAAIAGTPGVAAHRAANTLDAMVGHRSLCHARFGWCAARLDDGLGWAPARLTAALLAAAAPVARGRPSAAWSAWRRDGQRHASPNAGPCEAAMAGALGVTLGGRHTYPAGTLRAGEATGACPPAPSSAPGGDPAGVWALTGPGASPGASPWPPWRPTGLARPAGPWIRRARRAGRWARRARPAGR